MCKRKTSERDGDIPQASIDVDRTIGNLSPEKQEVCSGCEKLVWGPGYICSQCDFYLHKSCSTIPQKIQSPLHPSHSLVLLLTHEADICCYACGKLCNKCFVYHCSYCNFNLDIQCASQWQTNANDCHQHSFGPILQPIQFTCEACGEECKDKAHLCGICQLLVDPECTRRPRTIKTIIHDHKLRLIYSSHQVEKHDNIIFCKLCRQMVNTDYAAYYCQYCSYVAHLKCASLIEEKINWPLLNLDEEIIGTWGKTEIFRFYHMHKLFLVDEDIGKLRYNKLCDGCMLLISAPFYRCVQCDFFLHERCAKLQKIQRHRLHQHLLTLVSNAPSKDGVFKCNACHCYCHGFFYRCDECNYNLDIQCFTTLQRPLCIKVTNTLSQFLQAQMKNAVLVVFSQAIVHFSVRTPNASSSCVLNVQLFHLWLGICMTHMTSISHTLLKMISENIIV